MSNQPFSVIIPARLSSSRLPEKALADIHGKPMVVRTALSALQSQAKQVIVATDSQKIQQACEQYQINCILTKAEHPSGTDRLAEAVTILGLAEDEIVVNVQGDEPLINPTMINQVAEYLAQHQNIPMATVAHQIQDQADFVNSNVVKVVLDKYSNALYFSRSPIPLWRDAPSANRLPSQIKALRHVGLYAYRTAFLQEYQRLNACPLEMCESLEQLRVLWHGYRIGVFVSNEIPLTGVDTTEDLERVRQYFIQNKLLDK